jgi:hypothetical protein
MMVSDFVWDMIFFLFFLKVVSDICLVVFSVLVIYSLFLEWRLEFLFSFVSVFFMNRCRVEMMDQRG